MDRYRTAGPLDATTLQAWDDGFIGTDSYTTPENLPPGIASAAVNVDFSTNDAVTRGGFVCLPVLGSNPFGMVWTSRTPATSNNWKAVAYGAGVFVAVSASGTGDRVMTSPDGITWTSRVSANDANWQDVTYGNALFVAVGNKAATSNEVMTSPDGITWTSRTQAADATWRGVTYGNGLYVAVATGKVMTSPDGTTWTSRTPSSLTEQWVAVAYANSTFVAVSALTGIMSSTDGITWTDRSNATVDTGMTDIVYGNGLFVALGGSGEVYTSPDGITWTARSAVNSNIWTSIAYDGIDTFAAVANTGTGNRVMTSTGGYGWQVRASAADEAWAGIAYGANTFVAVASNAVMTSNTTDIQVWASGIYSDPMDAGSQWIMLVGTNTVGFYAFGRTARTVNIDSAESVSEQSTVVQCNNLVYIFRGSSSTPLRWDGNWGNEFELATGTIPESNQAIYCQNRLWAIDGKDTLSASDVLDFTTWNNLDNSFNISKGDSNFLVTTYPFGDTTIIVFKNRSIMALTGVDGALNDVVASEITRQVGAIGINAVVSVGPDLVYMSDRNINLLSLTLTNNSVQHKILPLSTPIKKIFDRVNWEVGYKVSMGYWDNKLYVALPLDNADHCNTVCVYNFITGQWYGEWNFDNALGMAIQGFQVGNYLGLQRLHAITEDGRIFVTDEGPQDITGTTVLEISSSLTTRPYVMDNNQKLTRRFWMDVGTWRPTFSVTAYSSGEGYSTDLVSARTYARSASWKYQDSTYSLTNSGDNYNRPWRKDYSGLCSESVQAQSGFNPNVLQNIRLPLTVRMKARLVHFIITNTQGTISVNGVGLEATPGDRQSYAQVG